MELLKFFSAINFNSSAFLSIMELIISDFFSTSLSVSSNLLPKEFNLSSTSLSKEFIKSPVFLITSSARDFSFSAFSSILNFIRSVFSLISLSVISIRSFIEINLSSIFLSKESISELESARVFSVIDITFSEFSSSRVLISIIFRSTSVSTSCTPCSTEVRLSFISSTEPETESLSSFRPFFQLSSIRSAVLFILSFISVKTSDSSFKPFSAISSRYVLYCSFTDSTSLIKMASFSSEICSCFFSSSVTSALKLLTFSSVR